MSFSVTQSATVASWKIFRGFLAMAALSVLVACSEPPRETPLARGTKVLALGDSLTAPHGVAVGEAWPTLLAGRLGWDVINGGISGDTTTGGLARLPGLLDEHAPQLVLVSLGGNDMLRRKPQGETIANLGSILAMVKARGARAVLLATPEPSVAGAAFGSLSPAKFYRQVAKDQQVPLIENALAEVLSDPRLKSDQLHPNAAGHALLATKIADDLKKIGYVQ